MKSVLMLVIGLMSFKVFAGPEDHMQSQVCYNLNQAQLSVAGENVPKQICIESLSINVDNQSVHAYSYFYQNLFLNLKAESFVRQTEDQFRFTTKGEIFSKWQSGCGEGEVLNIQISGNTDFLGAADVDNLKISVEQNLTNDTCHSRAQQTIFTYSK